jgi:wyosine [tRNA(Phe)-imidazoG37] synthetase (radical SAM superfamily)
LGVDLTPFKTCTLDCVFCQLGRTTRKTIVRDEYVPTADVVAELDAWLKDGGTADHITLAGSGEPTLHTRFGDVLQAVRDRTCIPTALLSNGTLFTQPEVREAAKRADLVKLTLSAWDAVSFAHIHRPDPGLDFSRIVDGYRAFRQGFHGRLWIEVFLLWGANTVPGDVEKIAALIESVGPDEIHLNTSTRPPAEDFALAAPRSNMERLAGLFRPRATVVAGFSSAAASGFAATEATILAMLERRPCTARQIAGGFGMHPNEVAKYLGNLSLAQRIRPRSSNGETYYSAVEAGNARCPGVAHG